MKNNIKKNFGRSILAGGLVAGAAFLYGVFGSNREEVLRVQPESVSVVERVVSKPDMQEEVYLLNDFYSDSELNKKFNSGELEKEGKKIFHNLEEALLYNPDKEPNDGKLVGSLIRVGEGDYQLHNKISPLSQKPEDLQKFRDYVLENFSNKRIVPYSDRGEVSVVMSSLPFGDNCNVGDINFTQSDVRCYGRNNIIQNNTFVEQNSVSNLPAISVFPGGSVLVEGNTLEGYRDVGISANGEVESNDNVWCGSYGIILGPFGSLRGSGDVTYCGIPFSVRGGFEEVDNSQIRNGAKAKLKEGVDEDLKTHYKEMSKLKNGYAPIFTPVDPRTDPRFRDYHPILSKDYATSGTTTTYSEHNL